MIDTHCHLTFPALSQRLHEVIADAKAHGVDRYIIIGTTLDDGDALQMIAEHHDEVWFTIGLHPHDAQRWADRSQDLEQVLSRFAGHPRCVAIGEMGLDLHYNDPPLDVQIKAFAAQLDWIKATACEKPIVIHNRKATDQTLSVLKASGLPGDRFVFHCFTGSPDEVDAILDFGATVGFTGVVTFKNAADVREAFDRVPLDRLLIETDSPYLTPEPYRQVRPNEPRYVAEVAKFLAKRRQLSLKAFVAQVDANAERLFGLT